MTHDDQLDPPGGVRTDPGSMEVSEFPLQDLFDADATAERAELAKSPDTLPAAASSGRSPQLGFSQRYAPGEVFARGGVGRIRRGYDRLLGREVAIKELQRELVRPAEKARFMREAMIASRLAHPSIIPIYDVGEREDGTPYFAMKLIEGVAMDVAIAEGAPLDELLPRVVDVAEAMAYAHANAVIHRDLKPANVLLGSFGETVVIDWGLAKLCEPDGPPSAANTGESLLDLSAVETRDGAIMGTLAYMPREQAAGQAVDARADVYALGALLYHVVLGERPWAQIDSSTALLEALLHDSPLPEDLDARVPAPALATILRKAMAPDLDHRYASTEQFAAELRRHLSGALVEAHRYSLRDLMGLWVRRHRAGVVAGALASVAVLGVATGAYLKLAQARDSERQAKLAAQHERDEAMDARNQAERARARELIRLDRTIFAQARRYVREDPAQAVAWMRLLSDDSPAWDTELHPLATEAAINGVSERVWPLSLDEPTLTVLSDTGSHLFAAGPGGVVRMVLDEGGVERIAGPGEAQVAALVSSADGRVAVLHHTRAHQLQVWREGQGLRTLELSVPEPVGKFVFGPVLNMDLSADGRWLGYAVHAMGAGPRVVLVDLERDAVVAEHDEPRDLCGTANAAQTVAISAQGWMAFAAGVSGKLRYWPLAEANAGAPTTVEPHTLSYSGACIDELQLSSSGALLLASLDADGGRIYHRRAGDRDPADPEDTWASLIWAGPDSPVHRHEGRLLPGPEDTARVWKQGRFASALDLRTREPLARASRVPVPEHARALVTTGTDDELTVVVDAEGIAQLWDTRTATWRGRVPIGTPSNQRSLLLPPYPAVIGADARGRLIYLDEDARVRRFMPSALETLEPGPSSERFAVANLRSPAGAWAVAAETATNLGPRTLVRVNLEAGTREELSGPSQGLDREPKLAIDDHGSIYALDRQGALWVWPLGQDRPRRLGEGIERFVVAATGSRVASADRGGGARVLELREGGLTHEQRLYSHGEPIADLALSPDAHRLAVAHGRGQTTLHELDRSETRELWDLSAHDDALLQVHTNLLWSRDGALLAMADRDGHIRVRALEAEPDTDLRQFEITPAVGRRQPQLALSEDGRWLAHEGFRAGGRHSLTLWDLESGAEYTRGAPLELDFDVAEGWIASYSQRDSRVILWHGPSDTQIAGPPISRPTANSTQLRFTAPDVVEVIGRSGPWTRWRLPIPREHEQLRSWLERATDMPPPALD